jgi:CDP-glucose 4,6-dehydratase
MHLGWFGKMSDLRTFYNGKRVFITGHTGFKGSWLSIFLHEIGAEVIGYALDPKSNNDLFVTAKVDQLITDIRGDISNLKYLESRLLEFQPEIIFHLAAQPLVIESYLHPLETWETNVIGTINLLEAIKKLDSVKSVVVITTDKVYKNSENKIGYIEEDPLGGHDPYSSSKAAVELAVESWRDSFFINNGRYVGIATARAGNVIGGGDWAENRLIPDFFRAFHFNQAFELRNPDSVRPWQHVLDVTYGYILLAKKIYLEPDIHSQAYNFSNSSKIDYNTKFIIDYLIDKLKFKDYILHSKYEKYKETKILKLLSERAYITLGWKNELSFYESLDLTLEYYTNPDVNSLREVVVSQIREYLERLR